MSPAEATLLIKGAVLCAIVVLADRVLGNEVYRKTRVFWMLLAVCYFPVTEGLLGRSLGKAISGTKVVDKFGRPPGIGKAIVRTLTRILEVNPLLAGGIPAGLIVNFSKTHQRWGDMLAGTFVIKNKDLPRITKPPGSAE